MQMLKALLLHLMEQLMKCLCSMLRVALLFMATVIQYSRLLSLYDILSRQHNNMKKSRRACGVLLVSCFLAVCSALEWSFMSSVRQSYYNTFFR